MENKTRKITLTDRAPVVIEEAEWPVIARATDDSWGGSDYSRYQQALSRGELDRYYLTVRRHADGRALVYAVLDSAGPWTHTEDRREGELLDKGADIARAVRRIGERCELPDSVIRGCIAELPAERI